MWLRLNAKMLHATHVETEFDCVFNFTGTSRLRFLKEGRLSFERDTIGLCDLTVEPTLKENRLEESWSWIPSADLPHGALLSEKNSGEHPVVVLTTANSAA